ncbi:unnamed protein product [Rotaria socialis]|uniref:Uncharacterized protein n=1 Tax=Rotaria socialis TaxID=392032 RepID=A0A820UBA4_9BILA|nr:unnamed protein product [Rotaria socialis]CAF3538356.1 unnamed protein product [Rotaria socialis]CAF3719334.1 unnamed protein product [Rotaria socialis]CAF4168251.1 unnamed protein product [Rotaria socialis]CAF4234984.1 unnamed protein product [Rotaria socialis]
MDDVATDPNDLLRQVETVSRSQRALVGEFERQRSRLEQVVRAYNHQQTARWSELRRQSEQIIRESRKQIQFRSSVAISERLRLQHVLDKDMTKLYSSYNSDSIISLKNPQEDKKRKVYGCLLPQLKSPTKTNLDNEKLLTPRSTSRQSSFKAHLEHKRGSLRRPIDSPTEQRNQMNSVINKCLYELEECNGDGYDHFLQTSEPMRNAQILAQQHINH